MANEGTDSVRPGADADAAASPSTPAVPAPKEESGTGGVTGGLRVSLMPSSEEEDAGTGLRRKLAILFAVLIAETVVIGALFLFVSRKEAAAMSVKQEMDVSLARITQQIKDSEEGTKAMTLFDSRVRVATELLDSHTYWTSLFEYLRGTTKPSVTYLNFSGDHASGMITIDAMGSSYRDVAEQIVILRENPMIEKVVSSSASASIDSVGNVLGISFGLVLKVKPEVWKPVAAEATAVSGQ